MSSYLKSPENYGTAMNLLETQRALFKLGNQQYNRQAEQQQQQHLPQSLQSYKYLNERKPFELYRPPLINDDDSRIMMMQQQMLKADNFGSYADLFCKDRMASASSDVATSLLETDHHCFSSISRSHITAVGGTAAFEKAENNCDLIFKESTAFNIGKDNLKKRNAEFDGEKDGRGSGNEAEAEAEADAGEVYSEVSIGRDKETKDNSKDSKVQKPDYIHVRARRGQATDSHSLAERARREKISKKMKYLEHLVPGCNKVTGKAGVLDEIINYVQSLQRQVEFLSMKLAALNPRLDFNIENYFAKQFPAYVASFPTAATSSEMANLAYLQYDTVQQGTNSGTDLAINPTQMAPLSTPSSSSVSAPEAYIDSSYFSVQPLSTWESGLQSFYNANFR